MKQLLEKIVQRRNPAFVLDEHVTMPILWQFVWQQVGGLFRGSLLLLRGRHPKFMLRGTGVRFFNLAGIRWGKMLKLGNHVYLSALGKNGIQLGNHVSIGAYSRLVVSTSLHHIGEHIQLGDNVGIGEYAYLGGGGGLTIGNDCIVGQYFSCHPENHVHDMLALPIRLQGVTRKGIVIGSNCWIGSKVTILDGVTLGNGCVIAAGAVVTKSFPDHSVIGGVPAKLLRTRSNTEINTAVTTEEPVL